MSHVNLIFPVFLLLDKNWSILLMETEQIFALKNLDSHSPLSRLLLHGEISGVVLKLEKNWFHQVLHLYSHSTR